MRRKFYLAIIGCIGVGCVVLDARAADKITPLDVKLGLWEVTTTNSMSGEIPIPPEKLAKLTPEQRARLEASMAKLTAPTTDTHKECLTKEKLDKDLLFAEDRQECTRTIVNSSTVRLEAKIHCEDEETKTDGTLALNVENSDSVKGNMEAVVISGKRTMKMHITFATKYLAASCGTIKP